MDLAPSLLISAPHLRDPNFDHTVVLVLEHDESGSFGLVVNRETDHTLHEFCTDQQLEYRGSKEAKVLFGGPVGTTQGFVLFASPVDLPEDRRGTEVLSGLWFGADRELLARLTAQGAISFRLLVGYAGWAPGQLDKEIAAGAWIPLPPDARLIFQTPPGELWTRALEEHGIAPHTIVRGGDGALN
jgi:putative transcriptional regulator